jgi:hypothetical protein
VKLRAAINKKEPLDAAKIGADNQCALGKWLQGEGKTLHGKLPVFGECVRAHTAFHKAAGDVAKTINAQKFQEATAMLGNGTPFASASTTVGLALAKLKREVKL